MRTVFVVLVVLAISEAANEKHEHFKKSLHHHSKHHQNKFLAQERCEVLCFPRQLWGPGPVILPNDTSTDNNSTTEATPLSNQSTESSNATVGPQTDSSKSDSDSDTEDTGSDSSTEHEDSEDKRRSHHHSKKHYVNLKDFHRLVKKYHEYTKAKIHSKHNRDNFPDNCHVVCPCHSPRFCLSIGISEESEQEESTEQEFTTIPAKLQSNEESSQTEPSTTEGLDEDKKRKRSHHKSHNKHNKHHGHGHENKNKL